MGKRNKAILGPHPVDVHVGRRLRLRRQELGLSLEEVGRRLGLTRPQVQHYERGNNRMSASTLWETARVLDVPIVFFFDGIPESPGSDDGVDAAVIPSGPLTGSRTVFISDSDCAEVGAAA